MINRASTHALVLALAVLGCDNDSSPLKPPPDRPPRSYRIEADGTGDYATIQAAIDASQSGDSILLANGRYQGDGNRDLVVGNHDLLIQSVSGQPINCIIDCDGAPGEPHRGVTIMSKDRSRITIEGITIEDGYAVGGGGGARIGPNATVVLRNLIFRVHQVVAVFCDGASPTILQCAFKNNLDGAISISGGAPSISACTFTDNYVDDRGAAIDFSATALAISDCVFSRNSAFFGGAALYGFNSAPDSQLTVTVTNCTFSDNTAGYHGGAGYVIGTKIKFVACSFLRNAASGNGGGLWFTFQSIVSMDNCLFYGNHGAQGAAMKSTASTVALTRTIVASNVGGYPVLCDTVPGPSSITFTCSDIYGNEMADWTGCIEAQHGVDGNIALDPLFCDSSIDDFRLQTVSPCAEPNSGCGNMGPLTVGCDPGSSPAFVDTKLSTLLTQLICRS
jgi:parallel beta helix pectate lyase-like protein